MDTLPAYGPTRLLAGLTTFVFVGALLLGALTTGLGVAAAVRGGGQDIGVHQRMDADVLREWPADVVKPTTVPVTIRIRHTTAAQSLQMVGRDLPLMLLFVVGLWLLRGIAHSLRDGDPFTAANVRRLRGIGFLLLFGVLSATWISNLFAERLAYSTNAPGLMHSTTVGVSPAMAAALVVFVLAQVFAQGVALRDDVEGTV